LVCNSVRTPVFGAGNGAVAEALFRSMTRTAGFAIRFTRLR
jgi:hypothetical protein